MHLSGVRPSVRPSFCLSVCPIRPLHVAAASLLLWARRPEISIDCCTARVPAVSSSRAAARRTALAANAGKGKVNVEVRSIAVCNLTHRYEY